MAFKTTLLLLLLVAFVSATEHEPCKTNEGCSDEEYCSTEFLCEHKNLFPINTNEIIGSVALFLVIGMASAAGIGGGGLTMPVIIIFFGF